MKKTSQKIVALAIIAISSMAFIFASTDHSWDEPYLNRSYLGFEHGSSEIEGEDAPFVGIMFGSKLSSRTSMEGYVRAQALSDFPESNLGLEITDTESAFAFMVGATVTTRLFRDAAFNPFIQVGIGNMAVGYFKESADGEEYRIEELNNYFFSEAATGLEVNIFHGLSIAFLHGYRYVPHGEVLGIPSNSLSGSFNTVSFKAYL